MEARRTDEGRRTRDEGRGTRDEGRGTRDEKANPEVNKTLTRRTHQTIKKITDDIEEGFHFNTAISSIMELVNEIYLALDKEELSQSVVEESIKKVIVLLSPFVPHIAEELWQKMGGKKSLLKEAWPSFDKTLILEDIITVPVQINGKLRSKVSVFRGLTEEKLKEKILEDEKTKLYLKGLSLKRWVIVPDKLVNIVTGV